MMANYINYTIVLRCVYTNYIDTFDGEKRWAIFISVEFLHLNTVFTRPLNALEKIHKLYNFHLFISQSKCFLSL